MMKGSVAWSIIFAIRWHLETGSSLQTIRPLLRQPNKTITKWCKWAIFIAPVDKFKIFGIKKNGTLSTQCKPCRRVNNELMRSVKVGDNIIYLGKIFPFDMNNVRVKPELVTDLNILISWIGYRYIWSTSYWLFGSIVIVSSDGDFLSITLQVPGLYKI